MIADLFVIKKSPKYGKGEKGIFAMQLIPKGTIMDFRCKKDSTYSREELAKMSEKELRFVMDHSFKEKSGLYHKYCDKRLMYDNHSCNANTLSSGKGFGIVVRDIRKGEEATSDYRLDSENSNEELHFVGGCKCGEKNCMKNSTFEPPAPRELQRFWNRRINDALRLIPYVKQPLKKELLAEHPELSYLFEKKS